MLYLISKKRVTVRISGSEKGAVVLAIYILFPVLLIIPGLFLCRYDSPKWTKIIYTVLFGLSVFILSAIRYMVGTDYSSYASLYRYFDFAEAEEVSGLAHEKGFAVTLDIINEFADSYVAMFAFAAFVIAVGVAVYIYRYSDNICISAISFLLFGLFFYSMNFVRQFIAAVILLYAIRYIHSGSFLRYLLVVLFASAFHWSALLMIPFYFILKIRLEPLVLAAYGVFSVMLFIFSDDIVNFGISIFYTKYQGDYTPDINSGVSFYYAVGYGILFIAAFLFRERLYKRDPANSIYINCLFFAVLFELLGFRHAMLSRFALLFIIPGCLILVPEMVRVITEKFTEKITVPLKKTFVAMTVMSGFIVFGVLFYGCLLADNSNGVVPYHTIYEYNISV